MNRKIIQIFFILAIIIFSFSIVNKEFQNDTFFTIALGEKILNEGLNTQEKLVWHENLEFTNPRWGFDLITAIIYNTFGFVGIYVFVMTFAAIQGVLYYYILNKFTKKPKLSFIFTIITMYFSQGVFAARSQLISFMLFLIEFYAIEMLLETNKNRYFVILAIIPIVLVNVHATVFPMYFAFYMPYIAEFILSKLKLKSDESSKIIIENKNINKLLILIIIGVISGFCTPRELNAYTYMFRIMNGTSVDFIEELQPIKFFDQFYFSVIILLIIAIMMFTKTKAKVTDCFFIIGFAFMSLSTIRCIYYFLFVSTICIVRIINSCFEEYEVKSSFMSDNSKIIIMDLIFVVVVLNSIARLIDSATKEYADSRMYPVEAVNYILENIDINNMRIYNGFNYGSYLEFNNIPAFMDSRSELYTSDFNEGITILDDFQAITYGNESYHEVFEKYNITHALLYSGETVANYIKYDDNWKLLQDSGTFVLYEKIK